jgi:hypothetical protein
VSSHAKLTKGAQKMSSESQQLELFAGDLNLTNMQLTSVQWETTLQRIAKDPALQPNLRALTLDENDLAGVDVALAATIGRLERLMDLSICDARLSGVAVTRLLSALGTLPAFAKSHAEVWAPIEVMPGVPQGARLCLMRNGISDAELLGSPSLSSSDGAGGGGRATPPAPAGQPPPCLRGVLELCLSGNPLVTDAGLAGIASLAPSLRRLYLGRTGICGHGCKDVLDRHWPMVEALSLSGTPMTPQGFDQLARTLDSRADKVDLAPKHKDRLEPCAANGEGPAAKAPASGGGGGAAGSSGLSNLQRVDRAVDDKAHKYVHLDVREVPTVSPVTLKTLAKKMRDYSTKLANQRWISRQHFGGGKHRSDGLVLRHDFEGDVTLRLEVELLPPMPMEEACAALAEGVNAYATGPFYVELPDLPQLTSLADVLKSVKDAVVLKSEGTVGGQRSKFQQKETFDEERANESRAAEGASKAENGCRKEFRRQGFPIVLRHGAAHGEEWQEERMLAPGGRELPCGGADAAQRARALTQLNNQALGALLHDQARAEGGRRLDNVLGLPALRERRRLVEVSLRLKLGVVENGGGTGGDGGDGASAAAGSAASPTPPAGAGASSKAAGKKRKKPQ